jgi:hypothetical protein
MIRNDRPVVDLGGPAAFGIRGEFPIPARRHAFIDDFE